MPQDPIDDDRLSAWLDGEFDGDANEKARIEHWLREHPLDAARVRLWAADRDALRAHGAALLDQAVPARHRALVLGRMGGGHWAQAAVAAGLLLAGGLIGGAAVWQGQAGEMQARVAPGAPETPKASTTAAAGWVQRAALAHSVYVPEPRHAVEVKAHEEHLARWLTRRIDLPVKLFDLRDFGFELVGGRLLPDGGGKSAQLMYQDAQGVRITVYLRKPDAATEAAFRYERQGELGLFYWVESGAGYALVGALPKEQLLAIAETIYRQHPQTEKPASSAPR